MGYREQKRVDATSKPLSMFLRCEKPTFLRRVLRTGNSFLARSRELLLISSHLKEKKKKKERERERERERRRKKAKKKPSETICSLGGFLTERWRNLFGLVHCTLNVGFHRRHSNIPDRETRRPLFVIGFQDE